MAVPVQTCYRHPDRRAGVSCQRCNRPICPSCMVQASVGFQCPECARGGGQKVYNARNLPKVGQPIVTYVLVAINVGIYLLDVVLTKNINTGAGSQLTDWGGLVARATYDDFSPAGVAAGEWWRIVTGGFLHAGIIHLAMNMLALWIVGSQIEGALGRVNYLLLYVTSLLAGAFAVLAFSPYSLTVGASGAIFGLFGVAFVYQRSLGINPWRSGIGGLIIINLIITFSIPGISWAGHLGGLVGGGLAALAVVWIEQNVRSKWAAVGFCALLCAAFFVGGVLIAYHPIVSRGRL